MSPFPIEDPTLDAEIARVYEHLKTFSAEDEEYQKAVDQLSKLYAIKNNQSKLNLELHQHEDKHMLETEKAEFEAELKAQPFFKRVDPNTVLTVAGNLAVALIVIKYEQTGVIATKVTSFMKKI